MGILEKKFMKSFDLYTFERGCKNDRIKYTTNNDSSRWLDLSYKKIGFSALILIKFMIE